MASDNLRTSQIFLGRASPTTCVLLYVLNFRDFDNITTQTSLVPRPLPDFISQLRDKIWEWPGDEGNPNHLWQKYLLWARWKMQPQTGLQYNLDRALTLINNLHLGESNLYLVPECFHDTYRTGSCATQRWAAMNNSVTAVSSTADMINIAPAKSVQCLDSTVPDIGADHVLLYDPTRCQSAPWCLMILRLS